jgi:hypothetical protein
VRASLLQNRNSAESEEKPWQAVARPLLDSRKLHPIVLATSRIVLASAFLSTCKCCCTCCCCHQKAFALLSFCSLSVSPSDKQSSNGCKFSQFVSTQKGLEEDVCTMESKLTQLQENSFTSGLMNPHSSTGCNNPCVSNKG